MIYDLSNQIDKNKASYKLDQLIKNDKVIELTEKRKSKTVPQLKYLHVCIDLYAIESGYTREEQKTELKRICPWMRYEKNGSIFLISCANLDTELMTDFIDFVRTKAGLYGIYIPTSEEYIANKINIDKEIIRNKLYL